MKNQLSENQIDQIAKNVVQSFSLDNETLDQIADSPKLLWNIRNQINSEKSQSKSWFLMFRWQIAAFAIFTIIFSLGFATIFLKSDITNNEIVLETSPDLNISETVKTTVQTFVDNESSIEETKAITKIKTIAKNRTSIAKNISKVKSIPLVTKQNVSKFEKEIKKPNAAKVLVETKTDFIALSYSPNTDSGQIVRVKVPRALMVSLGVSNNVSKNEELVTAEVILDNDGSTRAIRFISTDKR